MKVSTIQYSKLLYELTVGKSQQDVNDIIAGFLKVLQKNSQIRLVKNIIEKFSKIYNKKNGIIEVKITTREEVSTEVRTQVSTFVKNKYKAKEVVINNKIDENIKGGIIIKVGDEIVDASFKSYLINLNKLLKV